MWRANNRAANCTKAQIKGQTGKGAGIAPGSAQCVGMSPRKWHLCVKSAFTVYHRRRSCGQSGGTGCSHGWQRQMSTLNVSFSGKSQGKNRRLATPPRQHRTMVWNRRRYFTGRLKNHLISFASLSRLRLARMMASSKGRSTALQRTFAHAAYPAYCRLRNSALRLVYRPFYLASQRFDGACSTSH